MPFLLISAPSGAASQSGGGGGEPYDMSGFDIAYTHTWPTAPSPAGSETPTNIAQLQAAVTAGNATITPADGTYTGNLTFGSDIDLVLGSGVTLVGLLSATGSVRVRITGGNITGNFDIEDCDDWLLKNIYINGTTDDAIIETAGRCRRFGFVSLTTESTNGESGWAIHTTNADRGNGIEFSDWTLANCRIDTGPGGTTMSTGPQAIRLNADNFPRLTIVDTLFNESQEMGFGLRFMNITDSHFENVIAVLGIHANFTNLVNTANDGGLGGLITKNLSVYEDTNIMYSTAGVTGNIEGTISNSRMHKSGGGTPTFNSGGFTDGGGNTAVSWDGLSASIDYSRMPGKSSVASYGADH